jgi:hypothetical protein
MDATSTLCVAPRVFLQLLCASLLQYARFERLCVVSPPSTADPDIDLHSWKEMATQPGVYRLEYWVNEDHHTVVGQPPSLKVRKAFPCKRHRRAQVLNRLRLVHKLTCCFACLLSCNYSMRLTRLSCRTCMILHGTMYLGSSLVSAQTTAVASVPGKMIAPLAPSDRTAAPTSCVCFW